MNTFLVSIVISINHQLNIIQWEFYIKIQIVTTLFQNTDLMIHLHKLIHHNTFIFVSFLITSSQMVLIFMLGLLRKLPKPKMHVDSFSCLILLSLLFWFHSTGVDDHYLPSSHSEWIPSGTFWLRKKGHSYNSKTWG